MSLAASDVGRSQVQADLSPLIAATTQWLVRAYPADGGPVAAALAEAQARQAVMAAARLRYPTAVDGHLVIIAGPGGCARLDRVTGADADAVGAAGGPAVAWRTWVDEVVASWAACLLAEPDLAHAAVRALDAVGGAEFRRLVAPDASAQSAAVLLRHPDLLEPVATLHRAALVARLGDPDLAVAC